MAEQIFYEVFDIDKPSPEPFAVLAIYPERQTETGVEATVISLHMNRGDAEVDKAMRQLTPPTVQ